MAVVKNNYEVDPWDNDTPAYIHAQSTYYSGSYENVTATSTPNYPPALAGSPTRYFVELPGIVDVSDIGGTRPVLIRDVTNTLNLTRVTASPGSGEYRVAPEDSERRNIIEINSAQAGSEIGYDYYLIGGVYIDDDANLSEKLIGMQSNTSALTHNGYYSNYINTSATESGINIKYKIIELGDWDMDTNAQKVLSYSEHGLTLVELKKIRFEKVIVRNDDDDLLVPFPRVSDGYISSINVQSGDPNEGDITLLRKVSGIFDSINYDSTSYNRGWLYLGYEG